MENFPLGIFVWIMAAVTPSRWFRVEICIFSGLEPSSDSCTSTEIQAFTFHAPIECSQNVRSFICKVLGMSHCPALSCLSLDITVIYPHSPQCLRILIHLSTLQDYNIASSVKQGDGNGLRLMQHRRRLRRIAPRQLSQNKEASPAFPTGK